MATPQNLPQNIEGNTIENNGGTHGLPSRIKQASSAYVPKLKHAIHKRLLTYLMVLACILGVGVGVLLRRREEPYSERERMHLRFPGQMLVNMLDLLVLPLVVSSIISGISLEDTWDVGKLSLRTFGYFLLTYVVSSMLGVLFAMSIFPTARRSSKLVKTSEVQAAVTDTVFDLFRQMFPSNIIEATFQTSITVLKEKKIPKPVADPPALTADTTNLTDMATSDTELVKVVDIHPGANMLGIMAMSLVGGIVINRLGDKGLPLKVFFDAIFEITMLLISIINWYTPIGVFFLVVESVVSMDTTKGVQKQGSFFIAVIAAMLMHSIFLLPLICFVMSRRNPYVFMNSILNVLVTAIGTSSSLATLPFLVRRLEDRKMKLDIRTVGFVAPIGSSFNMNGSAIFNIIAVIFLGKLEGMEFGFWKTLSVGFVSIISAIHGVGTPQGGLSSVRVLTDTIGVVDPKIEYLIPLDWIVDRFVTSTNVLSDAFGCVVVHHMTKQQKRRKYNTDDESNTTFSSESGTQREETNNHGVQSTGGTFSQLQ